MHITDLCIVNYADLEYIYIKIMVKDVVRIGVYIKNNINQRQN